LNAKNLISILKCFELASGLKINFPKSRLFGIGVPGDDVVFEASSLGCSHDSLPFIYLGLLVGKRMNLCDGWVNVIKKFRDWLSAWKAKSLSIGGFKDSQCGICWVKRNSILLEHNKRGLGVDSILVKNLGLLGKWKWRYLSESSALWRVVIKYFYGNEGGFGSNPTPLGCGGVWCAILKAMKSIKEINPFFKSSFVLSNGGSNVSFWDDPWWCGIGSRLKDIFPRFMLLNWINVVKAIEDLSSYVSLIGNLALSDVGMDKWVWKMNASGIFKRWRNKLVNATEDSASSIKDEDIFPFILSITRTWISARSSSRPAN
nr:RNA-directed DNA polymerase, eukaryota, reverse transcriptase zinc-binding domain protein [Tanacetum cinerariifolium]